MIWGLALAGFGLAGPLWTALGCLVLAGAADTVAVVTRGALVQLEAPDQYRGRVSSVEHVIGVAGARGGQLQGRTARLSHVGARGAGGGRRDGRAHRRRHRAGQPPPSRLPHPAI
ncbi:hypothetical protein [Nonomuraea dietziae]|uniref:hypothetical protein n=1 Tax=Nonomuraea dietziae TaxID=65515 RepID=UPI0031D85F6F